VENAKKNYDHVKSGDVVQFTLTESRKNAASGTYVARVKTPTEKGFEVLINNSRVKVSNMIGVRFIHKSDGYNYSSESSE
jgi:hypothetical protein